jgi:mercuric ion transport protein
MTEENATTEAAPASGARQVAATIVRYGAMLFGTAVLVQIYLAGSGIFAAKGPVKDATSLDPHRLLGNILSVLALLLLIAVIVARPSRRVVITVIVLFVLTAVEGFVAMAGDGAPYVGALHPVLAVVIMGLTALVPLWTRNDTAQATA